MVDMNAIAARRPSLPSNQQSRWQRPSLFCPEANSRRATIREMSLRVKAVAALVVLVIAGVLYLIVSGLSLDERRDIGAAEAAIERNIPDGSSRQVRAAVDRLIEICRTHPDALYDGRSMREVLRDASGDLRRHRPHLADRLLWESERGLGPVDVGTP